MPEVPWFDHPHLSSVPRGTSPWRLSSAYSRSLPDLQVVITWQASTLLRLMCSGPGLNPGHPGLLTHTLAHTVFTGGHAWDAAVAFWFIFNVFCWNATPPPLPTVHTAEQIWPFWVPLPWGTSHMYLETGWCYYFHGLRALLALWATGNGSPLQYSCLENPMDGRALYSLVSWRVGCNWVTSFPPFKKHWKLSFTTVLV